MNIYREWEEQKRQLQNMYMANMGREVENNRKGRNFYIKRKGEEEEGEEMTCKILQQGSPIETCIHVDSIDRFARLTNR